LAGRGRTGSGTGLPGHSTSVDAASLAATFGSFVGANSSAVASNFAPAAHRRNVHALVRLAGARIRGDLHCGGPRRACRNGRDVVHASTFGCTFDLST